jgi:hypothetical protein
VDRLEKLQKVKSVDEEADILAAGAIFTITAVDGVGDKIEITLFDDDTGVVLSYVSGENLALGVPLRDVVVEYHTPQHSRVSMSVN